MTADTATKLTAAIQDNLAQIVALNEKGRALSVPAATGDEAAKAELAAIKATIADLESDNNIARVALQEVSRLQDGISAEASRKAAEARRIRASALAEEIVSLNCKIIDDLMAIRAVLKERGAVISEFCAIAEIPELKMRSLQSPEQIANALHEAFGAVLGDRLRGMPPSSGLNGLIPHDCGLLAKPVPVGRERIFSAVEKFVFGKLAAA